MTGSDVDQTIDQMMGAVEAFAELQIDPADATRVARRLRQVNRELWRQINVVEAMIPINVTEVAAELAAVGVAQLIESGVIHIDRSRWYLWKAKKGATK